MLHSGLGVQKKHAENLCDINYWHNLANATNFPVQPERVQLTFGSSHSVKKMLTDLYNKWHLFVLLTEPILADIGHQWEPEKLVLPTSRFMWILAKLFLQKTSLSCAGKRKHTLFVAESAPPLRQKVEGQRLYYSFAIQLKMQCCSEFILIDLPDS